MIHEPSEFEKTVRALKLEKEAADKRDRKAKLLTNIHKNFAEADHFWFGTTMEYLGRPSPRSFLTDEEWDSQNSRDLRAANNLAWNFVSDELRGQLWDKYMKLLGFNDAAHHYPCPPRRSLESKYRPPQPRPSSTDSIGFFSRLFKQLFS